MKAKRNARRGRENAGEADAANSNKNSSSLVAPTSPRPSQGQRIEHRRDLRTVFRKPDAEEVARGRADATRPLASARVLPPGGGAPAPLRCPESLASLAVGRHPPMPTRPDWRAAGLAALSSPAALDAFEEDAFARWLQGVYAAHPAEKLNHFEQNLEVWRQLWRVEERSDVVLMLADSRCPPLHFHATLYEWLRQRGKPAVLCLTKADLVDAAQATAWKDYFRAQFPELPVVHFASSPQFMQVNRFRVAVSDPDGVSSVRRLLAALATLTVPAAAGLVAPSSVQSRALEPLPPPQPYWGAAGAEEAAVAVAAAAASGLAPEAVAGAQLATASPAAMQPERGAAAAALASAVKRVFLRPFVEEAMALLVAREAGAEGAVLQRMADLGAAAETWSRSDREAGSGGDGVDSCGSHSSGGGSDEESDGAGESEASEESDGECGLGDGRDAVHLPQPAEEPESELPPPWPLPRREHIVVGLLGNPNVGKSSLLNTLLGKKKVSTSATPGHTKHMQTHFLCRTVLLCDCPGVIFPQTGVPRPLQVVFGSYPIAQMREPFAVVRYVAECCWPPLPTVFKLHAIAARHADDLESAVQGGFRGFGGGSSGGGNGGGHDDGGGGGGVPEKDVVWSPYSLAMALALREGFFVKGKGGRPDAFRAANRILRDALNGRGGVVIPFWPPAGSAPRLVGGDGGRAGSIDGEPRTLKGMAEGSAAAACTEGAAVVADTAAAAVVAAAEPTEFSPFASEPSEAAAPGAKDADGNGSDRHWEGRRTRREDRFKARQRSRLRDSGGGSDGTGGSDSCSDGDSDGGSGDRGRGKNSDDDDIDGGAGKKSRGGGKDAGGSSHPSAPAGTAAASQAGGMAPVSVPGTAEAGDAVVGRAARPACCNKTAPAVAGSDNVFAALSESESSGDGA